MTGSSISERRPESDRGYTLVEMTVALALTATLLGIVIIVFTTFAHVQAGTTSSYAELDQLTPVGTAFQRLLRTAVSPATGGVDAAPVPPFGIYDKTTGDLTPATPISTSALTFYSNTGTTKGPVMVVAKLSCPTEPTAKCPATTKTLTTTSRPVGVFVVQRIAPEPKTCPGLTTRPSTDRCVWTHAKAHTPSWTPSPKTVLRVSNVFVTSAKPIFAYHLTPPLNNAPTATPPGFGTPAEASLTPFAKCTTTSCSAAHVQSVTVDIEVHAAGAKNKVESQTVTYQLSTVSQTYSPAVG